MRPRAFLASGLILYSFDYKRKCGRARAMLIVHSQRADFRINRSLRSLPDPVAADAHRGAHWYIPGRGLRGADEVALLVKEKYAHRNALQGQIALVRHGPRYIKERAVCRKGNTGGGFHVRGVL